MTAGLMLILLALTAHAQGDLKPYSQPYRQPMSASGSQIFQSPPSQIPGLAFLAPKHWQINNWKQPQSVLNPHSFFEPVPLIQENGTPSTSFAPPFAPINPYNNFSYLQPPRVPMIPNVIPSPLPLPENFAPIPEHKKIFIISYELLLKNDVATGEKYSISEPLKTRTLKPDYTCEIDNTLEEDLDFESPELIDMYLKLLLQTHKDEVLECLYKSGVKLRDDGVSEGFRAKSKTFFSLPPTFVQASLKEGYVNLVVLKPSK